MKPYYYDAFIYDGQVFCTKCLPNNVLVNNEKVFPIFADSEWDYIPTCDKCGKQHDYISLVGANI